MEWVEQEEVLVDNDKEGGFVVKSRPFYSSNVGTVISNWSSLLESMASVVRRPNNLISLPTHVFKYLAYLDAQPPL